MARPTVLFVCLHGSAKSVIAAQHFQRLAHQRGLDAEAVAAGLERDAEIPPRVIDGLLGDGLDVRGQRPRPFTRDDAGRASRIVAFCEVGEVPAGTPIDRWDEVPAVSADYKAARDAIVARLHRLLDTCTEDAR